jgi:hypothetical protein
MRYAGLLARLGCAGHPVDRDGTGMLAEVYPAASLKQWALPHCGYKQPRSPGALPDLVTRLQAPPGGWRSARTITSAAPRMTPSTP